MQVWIYMTMLLKTWQTSHKKDRISEMRRSTRHKSVILYIVVMSASKILIAQKIWHLFKLSKLDVLWSNNIYHFINPISLHEGARPARAVKVVMLEIFRSLNKQYTVHVKYIMLHAVNLMTPLIIRCTNVEDSLKRFFMCLGLYNAKQINEKKVDEGQFTHAFRWPKCPKNKC